jgi:hypothetical protein
MIAPRNSAGGCCFVRKAETARRVADYQVRQALGWEGRAALMSRDYNGRIFMNLTRRDLAAAGVFALSTTTLILPAMAATDDEEAVKQAVEALRKAMLTQDKAKLETLTAEQLSYSHSDARLEDKAKFINAINDAKGCPQVA